MREKVEEALQEVRVHLQADGGDVELVEMDGTVAKVRLTGACGCCPMAQMTLKNAIETTIREKVPEVTAVEAVQ
ncbi:NifU family protein [Candidatus Hydrogenedentota bacterium]